ncbi:MAG: hypothetical protein R2719_02825 [Micropruina sp.]
MLAALSGYAVGLAIGNAPAAISLLLAWPMLALFLGVIPQAAEVLAWLDVNAGWRWSTASSRSSWPGGHRRRGLGDPARHRRGAARIRTGRSAEMATVPPVHRPRRRRGRVLVIVLVAVVLIAAAGGGVRWWLTRPQGSPQAVEFAPAQLSPTMTGATVLALGEASHATPRPSGSGSP